MSPTKGGAQDAKEKERAEPVFEGEDSARGQDKSFQSRQEKTFQRSMERMNEASMFRRKQEDSIDYDPPEPAASD